ncbi:hypothetical protein B0H14DRAFT_2645581 [Mycena olivaceomarginata]|nr:hypothetical protein B0H14DRAFT_2645581 [Mycena olivaceomarginata]
MKILPRRIHADDRFKSVSPEAYPSDSRRELPQADRPSWKAAGSTIARKRFAIALVLFVLGETAWEGPFLRGAVLTWSRYLYNDTHRSPRETFVIEYTGNRIGPKKMYELVKQGCVYILRVGPKVHKITLFNKEFVDTSKPTRINLARYINHSCDPNAVVELWQTPEGKSRALVISKKDIYPNEEITINYGRHELVRWVTVFPLTLAAVIVYHRHVFAGNVEVHRRKDDAVVTENTVTFVNSVDAAADMLVSPIPELLSVLINQGVGIDEPKAELKRLQKETDNFIKTEPEPGDEDDDDGAEPEAGPSKPAKRARPSKRTVATARHDNQPAPELVQEPGLAGDVGHVLLPMGPPGKMWDSPVIVPFIMAFTRNSGTNLFPTMLDLFLEIGGTSSRILNTLSNAGACV